MEQRGIPAVLMRGGTSRGLFIHAADLPGDGRVRDRLLLDLMGSPHPLQVDGLGGGYSSTSKVMIVSPSDEDAIDVDYLFAQVGVRTPVVDYTGNCGNLTAAVAQFAVEEGMVAARSPITEVRLRNLNTDTIVLASVRVEDGAPMIGGSLEVAGVARPGAPLRTTYLEPEGAVFDSLLPTGSPRDELDVPSVGHILVSIVDVTNPMVFVRADQIGLTGDEDPGAANADEDLLRRVESIRAWCAFRLGLSQSPEEASATSPSQPKMAVVAPGASAGADVVARAFSMQQMHHAFPVTGLLCLAAAAGIPRTIPNEITSRSATGVTTTTVAHAAGLTTVEADVVTRGSSLRVNSVSIDRTARRLMQGKAFVPM